MPRDFGLHEAAIREAMDVLNELVPRTQRNGAALRTWTVAVVSPTGVTDTGRYTLYTDSPTTVSPFRISDALTQMVWRMVMDMTAEDHDATE
jgi:hypothetical protein